MEDTRQKAHTDMSENCGSSPVQLTPTGPWKGDTLKDFDWIEYIAGFGPYQKATLVSSVTSPYCLSVLLGFFFFHINGKALVLAPSESVVSLNWRYSELDLFDLGKTT